ncbi:MAG: serpin family protein [Planctomycetaceae bacterium]|nr:serpin family protein [Planctomycetaceae bacterium]
MKSIIHLTILVALTINTATIGTAVTFAQEPKPQTEFGFNLYRTIVKNQPGENLAVSPYGVQLLLDLARHGADGETKAEIERVLGYTQSVKWEILADGTLTTAAALWTQQGYPILPTFLQTARENFGSAIEQADFLGKPNEAIRRINAWCSENTNGRIPTLFSELDPQTRLVLANAVHFAADWQVPFMAHLTRDGDFTLLDGTKTPTKLMAKFETLHYGETDDTLALGLLYKAEGYAMLFLLPKEPADFTQSKFAQWESAMTAEKLSTIRRSMARVLVDARLPKFTMETNIPLNETLKQLGMPTAFDVRKADFSKISAITAIDPLFISEVLQKTYVRVDELGTEAAAVTVAAMPGLAMIGEPPRPKLFHADRPFLYAIVKGDTILFLGRFVKPGAEVVVPPSGRAMPPVMGPTGRAY